MIKTGIIGASGFTGYELIKILSKHTKVKLLVLNSRQYAGKKIKEIYSDFDLNLAFTNYSIEKINSLGLDCIFLAVPHTTGFEIVPKLRAKKIIDLSADYRFKDIKKYEQIYKVNHKDKKSNKMAIYGLPELFKAKIKKAQLIANPGCYATLCILSVFPIQEFAKYIIFDCVSGYSGAGRQSKFVLNPSIIDNNFIAYNLINHRHKPEIQQFIKTKLSFTPHITNAFRGMLCTSHILLNKKINIDFIKNKFKEFYKDKKFINIVNEIPNIKQVANTNKCLIGGFEIDENNQLVIVSAIDNLIKGAAGQAVQNMNIAFGFDETDGLINNKK